MSNNDIERRYIHLKPSHTSSNIYRKGTEREEKWMDKKGTKRGVKKGYEKRSKEKRL